MLDNFIELLSKTVVALVYIVLLAVLVSWVDAPGRPFSLDSWSGNRGPVWVSGQRQIVKSRRRRSLILSRPMRQVTSTLRKNMNRWFDGFICIEDKDRAINEALFASLRELLTGR